MDSPIYSAAVLGLEQTLERVNEQNELSNAAALLLENGIIELEEFDRILLTTVGGAKPGRHPVSGRDARQLAIFRRMQELEACVHTHAEVPTQARVRDGRKERELAAICARFNVKLPGTATTERPRIPTTVSVPNLAADARETCGENLFDMPRRNASTAPTVQNPRPVSARYARVVSKVTSNDSFLTRRLEAIQKEQEARANDDMLRLQQERYEVERDEREQLARNDYDIADRPALRHAQRIARLEQELREQKERSHLPETLSPRLLSRNYLESPPRLLSRIAAATPPPLTTYRPVKSLLDTDALISRFLD